MYAAHLKHSLPGSVAAHLAVGQLGKSVCDICPVDEQNGLEVCVDGVDPRHLSRSARCVGKREGTYRIRRGQGRRRQVWAGGTDAKPPDD